MQISDQLNMLMKLIKDIEDISLYIVRLQPYNTTSLQPTTI